MLVAAQGDAAILSMQVGPASPHARRSGEPCLGQRWAWLGALLLAEWMILGVRFDSRYLGPAWWAIVLRRAGTTMPLATVIATAAVLLGGARLRASLRAVARLPWEPRRGWPLLLAHAVGFIALFRVTAFVLEGEFRSSTTPGLWAALWVTTAVVTWALLIGAALPARVLLRVVRTGTRPLCAAAAVGSAAFAAGVLTSEAWYPLGYWTLRLVYALLARIVDDAVADPGSMIVGTSSFSVEIAPECSGYQGIGLLWVFLAVYLWLFRARLRFPRALLLLPLGTALVWLVNALRILTLIALGTWISPALALGGFHSYGGSLLFCAVALGLAAAARHSRLLAAVPAQAERGPAAAARPSPTVAYLGPFFVLLAASMTTAAFSARGVDLLYPLRVAAVGTALWLWRRGYAAALRWSWSWTAAAAGALVGALWIALEPARADAAGVAPAGMAMLPAAWASAWLAARVLGSVVTVPLAEELAFRGYLLRRLVTADFERVPWRRFSWLAFVGSSLLFGAMHQRLLAGVVAGAVYALVLHRRGELADAVVAHATSNAVLAAWVLATGAWSLWA